MVRIELLSFTPLMPLFELHGISDLTAPAKLRPLRP
jgi:hypothetical protein